MSSDAGPWPLDCRQRCGRERAREERRKPNRVGNEPGWRRGTRPGCVIQVDLWIYGPEGWGIERVVTGAGVALAVAALQCDTCLAVVATGEQPGEARKCPAGGVSSRSAFGALAVGAHEQPQGSACADKRQGSGTTAAAVTRLSVQLRSRFGAVGCGRGAGGGQFVRQGRRLEFFALAG